MKPLPIYVLAAGDFIEFFTELLFGSGAWLGLIIILSLILLVVTAVKYSSVVFTPILIFLGILYLENLAADNNFLYAVLIAWGTIPILLFIEGKRN